MPECFHLARSSSGAKGGGFGEVVYGGYMSHSLNSLRGGFIGDCIGDYYQSY